MSSKAIIIDDEPKGRNILQQLLHQHYPDVKVLATAADADDGIKKIDQYKPDVIFLDVDMPRKNAFEMLKEITSIDFHIIFVTAHDHYALDAIKFSALDYLLKPIDMADLDRAINRLRDNKPATQQQVPQLLQQVQMPRQGFTKIAIASAGSIEMVTIQDILYCEADGVYTTVYVAGQKIVATKNLKEFEDLLTPHCFFRIHNSYLINLNQLRKYVKGEGGTAIMNNGAELEVSRRRKTSFLEALAAL